MFNRKFAVTSLRSTIVGVTALGMLVFTAGLPANASVVSDQGAHATSVAAVETADVQAYEKALESDVKLTPENIRQAMAELDAAGIPADSNADGSKSYELSVGTVVTMGTEPIVSGTHSHKIGVAVPMIGGGIEGNGVYITLNSTDQAALTNGGAAAIGAALCAIPAVGWAGCGVIAVVLAVATTYVNAYGLCANQRVLKLNADWNGNITKASCI